MVMEVEFVQHGKYGNINRLGRMMEVVAHSCKISVVGKTVAAYLKQCRKYVGGRENGNGTRCAVIVTEVVEVQC